jgi:hypothetical protein
MFVSKRLATAIWDYDDPGSLVSRMRARRIRALMETVEAVHASKGQVSIIDVGGTESYWTIVSSEFLDKNDVKITILNVPGSATPPDHGRFVFATGDGCDLKEYGDDSFDIAHSNSVIEHVGDRERAAAFGREIARIAPRYFVQTPNFWFPFEPHFRIPFFHWLPISARVWWIRHFNTEQYSRRPEKEDAERVVMYSRLLRKRELQAAFEHSCIVRERFLGLTKSLIAVR